MQQTVSHQALAVLWQCFTNTEIKKGVVGLKAAIGEEFEKHMEPIETFEQKDGKIVPAGFVPNTGPGYDRWSWARSSQVELNESQAKHLQEAYTDILANDGFKAEQWKGVAEAEDLLSRWTASKKEDTPTEDTTENSDKGK